LKNDGCCQQGTGDDLADVEGIEIQAFVQLIGTTDSLRPGREFPKLLFDDWARIIFDSAANDSALSPKLRGESESRLHAVAYQVRFRPGSQYLKYELFRRYCKYNNDDKGKLHYRTPEDRSESRVKGAEPGARLG
jgi:hypothetical protein